MGLNEERGWEILLEKELLGKHDYSLSFSQTLISQRKKRTLAALASVTFLWSTTTTSRRRLSRPIPLHRSSFFLQSQIAVSCRPPSFHRHKSFIFDHSLHRSFIDTVRRSRSRAARAVDSCKPLLTSVQPHLYKLPSRPSHSSHTIFLESLNLLSGVVTGSPGQYKMICYEWLNRVNHNSIILVSFSRFTKDQFALGKGSGRGKLANDKKAIMLPDGKHTNAAETGSNYYSNCN
uniref:Uncharacterized protein n=1 Tax=Cucumis melo TaxID=3656 RepID=A0A9I9EIZ3_CUCME